MKRNHRLFRAVSATLAVLLTMLATLSFAACGSRKPIIGILQFGSHESLNNCYDGIMQGLEESGLDLSAYNIQRLNSNFDMTTAQSQAKTLVNKGAAVILAIATPSAVTAANEADGAIPVVYCAVTDQATMANYRNVTGSSDVPNFSKQLEVVTAFMGKTDLKIGVLYSSDESSSPYQLAELKKAAGAYTGMEISDRVVSDITTIDTQVHALLDAGVDCFVNLLDNTIVGKLESNILPLTNAKRSPCSAPRLSRSRSAVPHRHPSTTLRSGNLPAPPLPQSWAGSLPPIFRLPPSPTLPTTTTVKSAGLWD